MKPWLDDGDVRLYHAHVLDALRSMPDGSVDCIITSPPYYGLRDYGTGRWEGGDAACDHAVPPVPHTGLALAAERSDGKVREQSGTRAARAETYYRDVCGKCGARRVDHQIGLEETPAAFIATLVGVFREARRVLADHGTCWINLGDSYNTQQFTRQGKPRNVPQSQNGYRDETWTQDRSEAYSAFGYDVGALAPKNLLGMPWRGALALQDDGWILRRDIIWGKPNPMPESVTDRCTSAHEYVFMLTKRPRYWYDADAVREPHTEPWRSGTAENRRMRKGSDGIARDGWDYAERVYNPAGRNLRSVWEIATQPTPEAHFATFPEELVRRCLLAGCPLEVCRVCGKPRERIVERGEREIHPRARNLKTARQFKPDGRDYIVDDSSSLGWQRSIETLGWSDCGHNAYRPGVVLDPFVGSGTTAHVARKHQRHAIGIDLNADYLAIAAKRLQQLSLLAAEVAP